MAINHTCATTDDLIYLIRHDTTHGLLKDEIDIKQLSEDAISLNGRVITLLSTREIAQLNWHKLGVDYVLECTGKFTKVDQAVRHVTEAKCKRVVISAPSADAPTFVYGVNSEGYHDSTANHVISAASCTTNCVTPILKALNDSLGVSQAFLTTVHAATQSQNILDGYSKKNRRLGNSFDYRADYVLPTNNFQLQAGASLTISYLQPQERPRLYLPSSLSFTEKSRAYPSGFPRNDPCPKLMLRSGVKQGDSTNRCYTENTDRMFRW